MEGLPPGFRFYPTEEELVSFYLPNKLEGRRQDLNMVIPVVNIYEFNPSDLPKFAGELCKGDPEQWFFFIPRQEKEARGGRPNRLTNWGYWKATGSPGYVYSSSSNRIIGMKRTMVFYKGRAPSGKKTQWKMNEYRAVVVVDATDDQQLLSNSSNSNSNSTTSEAPKFRQEFSLCRVYIKSKCLRAFDRRPSADQAPVLQQPHHHHHHQVDEATSSHQNNPMVEKTSSRESSSSGDNNANPSENMDSDNWDMAVDNEPLWEWENFNLF